MKAPWVLTMGMIEREIYALVKTDFSQICGNIKIINLLSLLSKILIQKLSTYLYIYASLTGHTLRFFAPYHQHPFSLFTLVLKPIVFLLILLFPTPRSICPSGSAPTQGKHLSHFSLTVLVYIYWLSITINGSPFCFLF